jgi:hypothetical protein
MTSNMEMSVGEVRCQYDWHALLSCIVTVNVFDAYLLGIRRKANFLSGLC